MVADATVVEIDGRVALFVPATDELAFLNATATDVLRLCDGSHTYEDIVSTLAQAYAVPIANIDDSVARVIDGFADRSLFGQQP